MTKTYKGSLSLEWYNKQKSILLQHQERAISGSDIPAPKINWINKDEALFYEIIDEEGKGLEPYWVDRNDIRVKEARPLIFKKGYVAVSKDKPGTLPGTDKEWKIKEINEDDPAIENILIKGDNLLTLNILKKHFENKLDDDKVKCIYIDPPYNTGSAFEYYDDNLENSEWLTLMRDRLIILRELLAPNGVLFVQISDKQVGYLQMLLDEVFGRNNFINKIAVRTKSPSGFQTVNLGVFETAEYILFYGKDKSKFNYIQQYTVCDYDANYNKYIENIKENPEDWKIINLVDYISKNRGFNNVLDFKRKYSKDEIEKMMAEFALKNSESVFRLTAISDSGAGKETVELKQKSKVKPNKVFVQKRESYSDRYILNGQEIAFYSKKVKNLNGTIAPTVPLTNIWTDIAWEGISNEGNVEFQKSKKPERLIKRIIEMSTDEGDLVLDCFCGSGTTVAVAHKLKRNWIGVEVGKHSDLLIAPRIKNIITGKDETGITKITEWKGGGSFKYYHLGPSIISYDKRGNSDFNWSLGKKFIEESLLLSYDYVISSKIDLNADKLFKNKDQQPTLGIQKVGIKSRVAIVSLNEPGGKLDIMPYDEIMSTYRIIKKELAPEYINIFTNRGVEMAYDSKPDDLEIIKVPHAIFAELEK